jgi:glycosyltransferase involved in cell wall biosynthesis
MKENPHILYVYPFGPFYPITSGSDLLANTHLEYFRRKKAKVDLLFYHRPEKVNQIKQFNEKYSWCNSIHELQTPRHELRYGEFLSVADYVTKIEPLKSLLTNEYDLVFNNYCLTAPIAFAAKKAKLKVLETVDHLFNAFPISLGKKNQPEYDLLFYKKVEFDLYKIFDKILFINQSELDNTPKIDGLTYKWIPPAWPFENSNQNQTNNSTIDILFLGGCNKPNRDGIDFFYNEVFFPYLRNKNIKLTIIGKVCNFWFVEDPMVKKIGFYSGPISEIYDSSKVVIIPILEGTGISIKTIEAFAFGKAIVSTPSGTRGMNISDNPLITIDMINNPEAFAKAIIDLIDNPLKRDELGKKAKNQFYKEHSLEVYANRMDEFLDLAS